MLSGVRDITINMDDTARPGRARAPLVDLFRYWVTRCSAMGVGPYIVAFVLMALFGFMAGKFPYGLVDAWGIWNLRAKFFLYSPADAFASELFYSHLDYPPLIPLLVATGWRIFGQTQLVPVVIHAALYALLIWQFRLSTWRMVLVGLASGFMAAAQLADVPLSLFLLGACMAYQRSRWLLMAICLSFAVMTKNEGMLVALAVMGTAIVTHGSRPLRSLIMLSISISLVLAYKAFVGVDNDVIGSTGVLDRALDPSRYLLLALMLPYLFLLWYGPLTLVLAMGVQRERAKADRRLLAMLGVILAGYVAIYVITPNEIVWHVTNSFDRLILHLVPAAIWATMPMKQQTTEE